MAREREDKAGEGIAHGKSKEWERNGIKCSGKTGYFGQKKK